MSKPLMLLAAAAFALVSASGVAWAATVACEPTNQDIRCYGTPEADTMNGADFFDEIYGYEGDDVAHGNGGPDTIFGDDGFGGSRGAGNDTIHGGASYDNLYGGPGDDEIHGQDGNDGLDGGPGDDTARGGGGNDSANYVYGEGNDTVYGEEGDDRLADRGGDDNRLYGGRGDDRISSSGPRLDGGPGADFVHLWAPEGRQIPSGEVRGGPDGDVLRMRGTGTVYGGLGDDRFDKTDAGSSFEGHAPHEGPRTLDGGPGNDRVWLVGAHDDTVLLRDGERDVVVSCGPGADAVHFDRGLDEFKPDPGCEKRVGR